MGEPIELIDFESEWSEVIRARRRGEPVDRDSAAEGDIIQLDNPTDQAIYYKGMHTAVVVSHAVGSNTFNVVDSNFELDDIVRQHNWDPYQQAKAYGLRLTIWRMGTAAGTPTTVATGGSVWQRLGDRLSLQ